MLRGMNYGTTFLFVAKLLKQPEAPPAYPLFVAADSAYGGRCLLAQVFGLEPGQVELQPSDMPPPRDALVYRLDGKKRGPLGERWALLRG